MQMPRSHLLLILAMSIIAMAPAFWYGVPSGNDQTQHYQFAWTVYDSAASGDVYPTHAEATNHGLGDYGLRFYPPLTYYAMSAVYAVVRDWYFASLLSFTLVFFAGGVGIYLWAREEFEPPQALIAAMLYTFAPYHLNEIYNNFLLAEFFATAILPFCFLYISRVCRRDRWGDVAALAAAYALLILTHLPLTIVGSIGMGVYALMLRRRGDLAASIGRLAIAALSGVVMTAFYWSRWLPELGWIAHASPRYFATTWDYRSNFLLVPDHFLKFGEDALNLWFADIMLAVMLIVAVPTLVFWLRKRSGITRFETAAAALLAFAVFMTTPISGFVWNNAAFLQKVQFPWRWLALVSAFGAIFGSIGIIKASDAMKTGRNPLIPITLGMTLVVFFFTAVFVTRGPVYIPRAELNALVAATPVSEGCDCWWPIWAQRSAFGQAEQIVVPGRQTTVSVWSPDRKQFHVAAGVEAIATVRSFYYPRWEANVNGVATPVHASVDGTIEIAIPADDADVVLTFREPGYVWAAAIVSLAAWLLVVAFGLVLALKSRRETALQRV